MKGKSLEELEIDKNKLQARVRLIDNSIEVIHQQKTIPELRKKYEGKYWRYRNCVSDNNSWWLYSYCRKVTDVYTAIFDRFEATTANDNECVFRFNESGGFHLCQKEITKSEYMKALNNLKAKLEKLNP